ncbi:MAG TPA: FAD-dependent oxidoreductase [Syntrophorhabdales bacterium]|nr:FAD-dependent oxidoreductase [Syntrophorhabdales bacterium]
MTYDIIIIGNSAAGLTVLKTLRRLNRDVSIALIDREDVPAYSRVLTPYYIGGDTSRKNLFLVAMAFYGDLGVDTFFGKNAVSVDGGKRQVLLDDATGLSYRNLLIATGAESKEIGIRHERVLGLRHLRDADRLRALFQNAASVVGLGAGLVTLPTLSHLAPGVEKSLVVSSGRILSRVLDAEGSLILEERMKQQGIAIYKKDDISDVQGTERLAVRLASGAVVKSDVVLVGKGVTPNVELARKAGCSVDRGIIIDEYCRTTVEGIWAAGDNAQGVDFVTGGKVVQGNWITAVEQGEIAAMNMLNVGVRYAGSLRNNTTEIFGHDIAVAGYTGDDAPQTLSYVYEDVRLYRKIFLDKKERVIGVSMIGETNDAGIYYGLIRRRAKLADSTAINHQQNYARTLHSMDYR